MYGLPKDIDLSPFSGQELIQVCMGAYQYQLHLTDIEKKLSVSVSVESSWNLIAENGKKMSFSSDSSDRSEEAAWLTRLLGKTVTKAEAMSSGTLKIVFSNKWTIEVLDDRTICESYQINIGDNLIVV